MRRFLPACLAVFVLAPMAPSLADDRPPDLVRLPGEGELKEPERAGGPRERLLPGGGLFVSFDADRDGEVSMAEIDSGIRKAFETADADGNGVLTALEQQDWASQLPTRDQTLANPVRFDPNLDRRVSAEEFADVILGLASDYRDEQSEIIEIAALKAPPRRESARARLERPREPAQDRARRGS